MVEAQILRCNRLAMESLRNEDMANTLKILNEAQELLKDVSTENQVWGITFNNLGCYFKKTKEYETALKHFNKALEIEIKRPNESITLAGTYLNISSIYSELSIHEQALKYGLKSLNLLSGSIDKDINIWTSIVVSHHCVALEYEFLNKKQEALNMYRSGWEIAKEKLGKNHKLSISMKKSIEKCQSLKSSVAFVSARNRNLKTLQYRSHSSNPHSRLKFPQVSRKIITPTKEYYHNLKTVEPNPPKHIILPSQQVSALSSLVKEIEKTFEQKPRKYVFRKKREIEFENTEEAKDSSEENSVKLEYDTNKIPSIRKNVYCPNIDLATNNWLQIIPESNHEDALDGLIRMPPAPKKMNLKYKGLHSD